MNFHTGIDDLRKLSDKLSGSQQKNFQAKMI